jgi:hypothetical protein
MKHVKPQTDPNKIMSMKLGVYATHDDPEVWVSFDPEDIVEMAMVQENGYNFMFMTIQRGGNDLPIWRDYGEFFDVAVGMCGSTDFLAGIQALKRLKDERFNVLAANSAQFGRKPPTNTIKDLPN